MFCTIWHQCYLEHNILHVKNYYMAFWYCFLSITYYLNAVHEILIKTSIIIQLIHTQIKFLDFYSARVLRVYKFLRNVMFAVFCE